ncbi:MAG: hypothetical protein ABIQ18_13380 [Umezawaea sp.]
MTSHRGVVWLLGIVAVLSGCAEPPPADPSTWTLPVQAYLPTKDQEATIGKAEQALVERCVKGFGIEWRAEPELPPIGPTTMLDWRYGIHDARLSARIGYQVDPEQQVRYDAVRRGSTTPPIDTQVVLGGSDIPAEQLAQASAEARLGTVAGKPIPDGGCFGEARRALGSTTHGVAPLVTKIAYDSYLASQQDPDVVAVFAAWSTCMHGKGFDYAMPMDANDDPRFAAGPHGPSRAEIRTALADIACRDQHRVAQVWHEAETRVQTSAIEKDTDAFGAVRRDLDDVVRAATAALARP